MLKIYLESLCCVDSVESSDVLEIVECWNDGDDVGLDEVFRHDTEHRSTMAGTVTVVTMISCRHVPCPWLRSQYLQSLIATRYQKYTWLIF